MGQPLGDAEPPSAMDCGRICAVAGQCQRDLQRCAASYPDLFRDGLFDSALFSTIALHNAFSAPWLDADQLRIANRAVLWAFGLDYLVDRVANSLPEVHGIVRRCLAVAEGDPPGDRDPLGRFLAEIRDEMAAMPTFTALRPVWHEQLRLTLNAMVREWDWRAARIAEGESALPTFDEYLDNADNLCFAFVSLSHWISVSDHVSLCCIHEIRAVTWEAQRVMRLLNDLGTYSRDVEWGDLNALMLGVSRGYVIERIAEYYEVCRQHLRSLRDQHPLLASHLERQIEFNMGFWRVADYWGELKSLPKVLPDR
jgi:Terpene synthase family 2, C-terminal metal binding